MKNNLEKKGRYEILETTSGNEIIVLNDNLWFVITQTSQGHILVKTDSDHEKKRTVQKGKFYLADINEDPDFKDMPHLFLEKGDKYEEFILPKDLPTEKAGRKKVVFTDDKVSEKKVKRHVKNKEGKVRKEEQLEDMNKNSLYEKAKGLDIEGRSKMDKKELADAIREHE